MIQLLFEDFMASSACFSPCERYRYRLGRTWDEDNPMLAWIMLNPSTADAIKLDPTLRRCVSFSRDAGFGSMTILNLFALRATNPDDMLADPEPVGPSNDGHIIDVVAVADEVLLAWGNHGGHLGRDRQILDLLAKLKIEPLCLGVSKTGQPLHPLYLPKNSKIEPFVKK